jgi:endoglucanase Acf2
MTAGRCLTAADEGDRMKLILAMALTAMCCSGVAQAQPVKLGSGTYFLSPQSGDPAMPRAPWRTEAMLKQAAPTSQWYSSLIFNEKPDAIFVQPITVKPTAQGLEFALPSKEVVPTFRLDVEIRYPHKDALVLSPVAFAPGQPKLAKVDDWSIDISLAQGADDMRVTVAHGSPYASLQLTRGDLRVKLPAAPERAAPAGDPRVLAIGLQGKSYALFAPTGVRWENVSATEWIARLPEGKGYVSAAALPDASAETLALFTRHAYAFIEQTRVAWRYEQPASAVVTEFKATTRTMEGPDNGPLLGLYPHHWNGNAAVQGKLSPLAFQTIRGQIKLLAASGFETRYVHNGFVPYLPALKDSPGLGELKDVMGPDLRNARRMMLQEGKGPYWQGKGLLRTVKLIDVFEQQGDMKGRERLLEMVKQRAEEWLSGERRNSYFHYDKELGSVAAYPNEFFVAEQINDHHFTYGYWIRAVAEIALRDPTWAAKDRWGGMIDLLVADIATAERGRADFPFLRNFDAYEGHSWASGISLGEFGNNQEASSEAINAWAGLVLWGEVNGDTALRDLGLYLMTTEIQGIEHYWSDVHGIVHAPEYKNPDVSILFGGRYEHNTWWTDEPRQITGINLLPLNTATLYLGRHPKYVRENLDSLVVETKIYNDRDAKPKYPPPDDVWQDIFAKYLALIDPEAGLKAWDRWGSVELGDSRTSTLHFLLSLQAMGAPDFSVTADTPLYSVFKRADGKRSHLAFNAGRAPINVKFSDGTTLAVPPGQRARAP